MKQYDVAVIGAGPGGYAAAIRAARKGASVAVIEKDGPGGTCLNRGCIPTKALTACADAINGIKGSSAFGIEVGEIRVDFKKMMERKADIVKKLANGIGFLFGRYKVDLIKGEGRILAPDRLAVGTEAGTAVFSAKSIILATGSEPVVPSTFNHDGKRVLTSDELLELDAAPGSLLIIGAGVIGCEFAGFFSTLGCKVTMLDTQPHILPTESSALAKRMERILAGQGIGIKTGTVIRSIEAEADGITAHTAEGERIHAEKALVSVGRRPALKNLGLAEIGLALDEKGAVIVDEKMRTNLPGIYAIGDITNKLQLAHVASAQGRVAAENALGGDAVMDYSAVPACIFTNPEIASIGMDMDTALKNGYNARTGSFSYKNSGKALAMGETEGLAELTVDKNTDKLLGARIMGAHASDLISEIAVCMKNGLTCRQLAETIHPHPTLSEILQEAADAL